MSGYAGGERTPPSKRVGTGLTGHAESVQITFDPRVDARRDPADIFSVAHDPTGGSTSKVPMSARSISHGVSGDD